MKIDDVLENKLVMSPSYIFSLITGISRLLVRHFSRGRCNTSLLSVRGFFIDPGKLKKAMKYF